MAKILCVEDTDDTIAILELTLQGHSSKFVRNLGEARRQLEGHAFDLILLDISLPDGSGLDLMTHLYAEGGKTPVIFLTSKRDLGSKATAFSLGAEDFIVKPFDPAELKLRIDAKIRKRQRTSLENQILRIGDLACLLDEQRVENRKNGKTVDLTSLEFKILVMLARTPNKIFTRAEILDRAWGGSTSVSERAVDVHVSNLRKKLAGSGATIDGVIGTGYRIQLTD